MEKNIPKYTNLEHLFLERCPLLPLTFLYQWGKETHELDHGWTLNLQVRDQKVKLGECVTLDWLKQRLELSQQHLLLNMIMEILLSHESNRQKRVRTYLLWRRLDHDWNFVNTIWMALYSQRSLFEKAGLVCKNLDAQVLWIN